MAVHEPLSRRSPEEAKGLSPRRWASFAAVDRPRDVPVLLLALLAAFTSIAALIFHALGWMRMPFTVSFLTVPGLVLLAGLGLWAGRTERALLLNRLIVGAVAGLVGLLAYDLARWLVQAAFPVDFDAFFSMRAFGTLMTGLPPESARAALAGWAYHVSNGITFGIVYCCIAGPARWWFGLAWGLVLETGMILVYLTTFDPSPLRGFLVVSIVGHLVFGATVGLISERHALGASR